MQSLILPPAPFITTPQFGLPRFNSGPDRLPLNRFRSTNARGYSPRALPPPRPMSGSIPAEDPLEISGHARRPGHPELPQPVTTTTGVSSSVAASTPTTVSTHEQPPPPFTLHNEPSTSSRWPAPFGLHGVSQGPEVSYPPPPLPMASPPEAMSRNLSQKQTRRTKAHVASACVNCKKKHLGCDPARPCRRCVLSGKAATCVDVTHKKRGRPPLKAEDTSLRPYGTRIDQSSISGHPQSSQSSRRTLHRTTGSREIRPVTDLQLPGAHPGALGLRTGPPHRWSTSVFPPQAVDPSLTMPGSLGHRRFSSSGSIQSLPAAPPPPFVPMAGGLSPVFGSNRMPPVMGRPPSSYASQPLQPQSTSSPPYQQFYGESPYMSRAPMGESPISRDPQESSYLESPVRLPPIFPPMPTTTTETTSPTGHRLSDPYPYTTGANWSPRTREEQILPQERRPPVVTPAHTQPGLMEPVSPQTQIYQPHHHHHHHHHLPPASEFSYTHTHTHTHTQPLPRPPESITPAHRHSIHLPSSTHARDEAPFGAEAEGGDGRPTKRRKMALDDMVND